MSVRLRSEENLGSMALSGLIERLGEDLASKA